MENAKDKVLSQKEIVDFIFQLEYPKLFAMIEDLIYNIKEFIIEYPEESIIDFEVYLFDNFKTQLMPRLEVLLVSVHLDFLTGVETKKVIYSSSSFGLEYKKNVYDGDNRFGIRFSMVKLLIEATKENVGGFIKNHEVPQHFLGEQGEDLRLAVMQPLTLNTYENLK
jgi:hypothetical protein